MMVMGIGLGLWITFFMVGLTGFICLIFSFTDYFAESVVIMVPFTIVVFIILIVFPREKSSVINTVTQPIDTDTQQVIRITVLVLLILGVLIALLGLVNRWSKGIFTRTRDDRAGTSSLIPSHHRTYRSSPYPYSQKYKYQ
eukprot:GDKJ01023128.1.p1 GENE.GDKJ01023128.1~~GDKJ01023128.1.p1  ORF type:complete len:141 (-),score=9.72 GDKJ01023128.1:276-698(-)